MTTPAHTSPAPAPLGGAAVVAAGSTALLARPVAVRAVDDPTAILVLLFVALGLAGLCWPLARAGTIRALAPGAALGLGLAAFAVARLLAAAAGAGHAPPALAPLVLNGLAAVAEEAFFRRLLYGLLAPNGTTLAVVGSALCFAAVHLTVWGVAVLPLDLAAGLVLGWQRAVTGSWRVPAATHVAANVLATL